MDDTVRGVAGVSSGKSLISSHWGRPDIEGIAGHAPGLAKGRLLVGEGRLEADEPGLARRGVLEGHRPFPVVQWLHGLARDRIRELVHDLPRLGMAVERCLPVRHVERAVADALRPAEDQRLDAHEGPDRLPRNRHVKTAGEPEVHVLPFQAAAHLHPGRQVVLGAGQVEAQGRQRSKYRGISRTCGTNKR
jgi:hypothetical protein